MSSPTAANTTPDDQLSLAEDALVRAVAGQEPVVFVNEAFRIIGDLAYADALSKCKVSSVKVVCSLMREVKPILSQAVMKQIDAGEVAAAFDAAIMLLMGEDASRNRKNLLAMGILKSDLTGIVLRAEYRLLGDVPTARLN